MYSADLSKFNTGGKSSAYLGFTLAITRQLLDSFLANVYKYFGHLAAELRLCSLTQFKTSYRLVLNS